MEKQEGMLKICWKWNTRKNISSVEHTLCSTERKNVFPKTE